MPPFDDAPGGLPGADDVLGWHSEQRRRRLRRIPLAFALLLLSVLISFLFLTYVLDFLPPQYRFPKASAQGSLILAVAVSLLFFGVILIAWCTDPWQGHRPIGMHLQCDLCRTPAESGIRRSYYAGKWRDVREEYGLVKTAYDHITPFQVVACARCMRSIETAIEHRLRRYWPSLLLPFCVALASTSQCLASKNLWMGAFWGAFLLSLSLQGVLAGLEHLDKVWWSLPRRKAEGMGFVQHWDAKDVK